MLARAACFLYVILRFVSFANEDPCQEYLVKEDSLLDDSIRNAMKNADWLCAKHLISTSSSGGDSNRDFRQLFDAEQRLIMKELSNLKSLVDSFLPMPRVSPAFQWAQSPTEILLNLKFSHKLDAPATLNVEAQNVTILTNRLLLQASDGRKKFVLDLTFLKDIVPEESRYDMASVGRMTFTLKKASKPSKWKRLMKLPDKKGTASQVHFWWEMHEKHSKELDKLDEEDDVDADASKNKTNSEGTGPATGAEGDGQEAEDGEARKEKTTEEMKVLAAKLKEIDSETKQQIKAAQESSRQQKQEIDRRCREEKANVDTELQRKVQEIEEAADTKKEALKADAATGEEL